MINKYGNRHKSCMSGRWNSEAGCESNNNCMDFFLGLQGKTSFEILGRTRGHNTETNQREVGL
jgi:hypothetical protein